MRLVLLPILLLACAPTDAPVFDDAPRPPPGTLALHVTDLVHGEPVTFSVNGASPGERITLGYAPQLGAGPCPTPVFNDCVQLDRPRLVVRLVADARGEASFSGTLPTSVPLGETFMQAAGRSSGASNVVMRIVQPDPPVPLQICDPALQVQDPYNHEGAVINGDTLFLDVSYSGGCRVHEFTACWNGAFALSLPAQAWVDVTHDSDGDLCRAFLFETRRFDLSPMRQAYGWGTPATIVTHVGPDDLDYLLP